MINGYRIVICIKFSLERVEFHSEQGIGEGVKTQKNSEARNISERFLNSLKQLFKIFPAFSKLKNSEKSKSSKRRDCSISLGVESPLDDHVDYRKKHYYAVESVEAIPEILLKADSQQLDKHFHYENQAEDEI